MTHRTGNDPPPAENAAESIYQHRRGLPVTILCMLCGLFGLLVLSVLNGPGFDASLRDLIWVLVLGMLLLSIIAAVLWVLWRRPVVMIVSGAGIHLPLAFRRPLHWEEIHRIRSLSRGAFLCGRREWLIIDPSPGVLAPIRLPIWRPLHLWFQKHHGVRIPLHGLDADAETIVKSIQRYHPVFPEDG